GGTPRDVAFSPDGTKAYVANATSNTVTPIAVASNTAGTAIPVTGSAVGIAFSPDGSVAYVAGTRTNTVTPITVANNAPGTAITGFSGPFGVAFAPPRVTPSFTVSSSPTAGTAVTFNGSASTSTYSPIATYAWDFGDGATTSGSSATTTHTYTSSF